MVSEEETEQEEESSKIYLDTPPKYKAGDTVYHNGKIYEVEGVTTFEANGERNHRYNLALITERTQVLETDLEVK